MTVVTEAPATQDINWRGQAFRVIRHYAVTEALAEFRSASELGTLRFFDAALPHCDTMVDVGAFVGLMSLYVAGRVERVHAFEPSPANFRLLRANIGVNEALAGRMTLHAHGLGERDACVPLYRKGPADSGSSIFQIIERRGIIRAQPEADVDLRDADAALRAIGLNGRTLLKIDIEGAEYLVVPAIAALLAETRPFLHLSFHPFNIVAGGGKPGDPVADAYPTNVERLWRALRVAEALAPYRYMFFHEPGTAPGQPAWQRIERADRMSLLRQYLLRPKPVRGIATPQYGFIDTVCFADVALEALDTPEDPVD